MGCVKVEVGWVEEGFVTAKLCWVAQDTTK